jgi:hypothetical protein
MVRSALYAAFAPDPCGRDGGAAVGIGRPVFAVMADACSSVTYAIPTTRAMTATRAMSM